MFTDKAQKIIDSAKDYSYAAGDQALSLLAFLPAITRGSEAAILFSSISGLGIDTLRSKCAHIAEPAPCSCKMPLSEPVREIIALAKEMAIEIPDRAHPRLINVPHLLVGLALSREFCALLDISPVNREDAVRILTDWSHREDSAAPIGDLIDRLKRMRSDLLVKVFGQDHAIEAFVEGVFNSEIVADADSSRRSPRAVFVFAGPPGVGKTFLAESAAAWLDRPFRRFDLATYSDHQASNALVGFAKSYNAAHPGILTEFVAKNPNAVLLFDEVEQAHLNTIMLFLQILDAGVLEDKYHERNVSFRDTIIIFTTNAGRKLYDRPNECGVHAANMAFHRNTIVDALQNEKDPRTGQPSFPPAICSRLATGYPVLFNRLRVNELQRVAQVELSRLAGLLERQYYKRVTFSELLAMALVLREGARVDARTVRSQVESFVKTELFKFCQLFNTDRIEEVLGNVDSIQFLIDQTASDMDIEVGALLAPTEKPRVLLVSDVSMCDLYRECIPEIDWRTAITANDALQILADEDVDMALVDLWLGKSLESLSASSHQFDHVSITHRGLDQGQEVLRKIRDRLPNLPVFLLSLAETDEEGNIRSTIDDELFMACVRGGGARGMLISSFVDTMVVDWRIHRERFQADLLATCRNLYRERAAERMGDEHRILSFDTEPKISKEKRSVTIRLQNLRIVRALAAADAGEVVEEVERPRTRFADVIGANNAKTELKFFIEFLKNPRRFAALGLKPPKGVLLHGQPGTGKTMLARAMAGESNVAFLPVSASNFVTVWQGSGPQNVRELFARARRYAPAIVFIDEIDAVGKARTGIAGGGQAEESTLNALLVEMDGFASPSPDRPVFVLAATNYDIGVDEPDGRRHSARALDPALVRRFSRTILVELPERASRQEYLTLRLREHRACTVSEETIKLIAARSIGMSIANLETIIETAARNAIKGESDLTSELLEEAFEAVRFGETRPKDEGEMARTAHHEAGHAVLYWLSGYFPEYVTVVSRGEHSGYMAPAAEDAERQTGRTKQELLWKIRVLLSGRATEIVYFGEEQGLSTGASDDLERATDLARSMVCRYGMDKTFGLLVTPELMKYEGAQSSPVFMKVNRAASKILMEQLQETTRLIQDNRAHIDAVADALLDKERLTAEELRRLLPEKKSI